jgi:hypothetical protein
MGTSEPATRDLCERLAARCVAEQVFVSELLQSWSRLDQGTLNDAIAASQQFVMGPTDGANVPLAEVTWYHSP